MKNEYKEYTITSKQHKEIFPYAKKYFGLVKYRYYVDDNVIKMDRWYSINVLILWFFLCIPLILWCGIKETMLSFKEIKNGIFNTPFATEYIYKYGNKEKKTFVSKKYELFKKYVKEVKNG